MGSFTEMKEFINNKSYFILAWLKIKESYPLQSDSLRKNVEGDDLGKSLHQSLEYQ